jgi:hypothetical protein
MISQHSSGRGVNELLEEDVGAMPGLIDDPEDETLEVTIMSV